MKKSMIYKLIVPLSLLIVGCGKIEEPIDPLLLSYKEYFSSMKERDVAGKSIDCEELVSFRDHSRIILSPQVLNYIENDGYQFKQCAEKLESVRLKHCDFVADTTQQHFFENKVNKLGQVIFPDSICKTEIENRLLDFNQAYKLPSPEAPFFELIGKNTLFNPASITEVTWAHNDVYAIHIETTGKSYKLFFTDKRKFNTALTDIKNSLLVFIEPQTKDSYIGMIDEAGAL